MRTKLSEPARRLKVELQTGSSFGVLQYYPGIGAFSGHAVTYLSNAAALCFDGRSQQDFKVYGAVYGIRHGLELWLKGVVHAARVDAAWHAAHESNSTFMSMADAARLQTKAERNSLRRALCVLRNVVEDRVTYPDCHRVRMESNWADRAVTLIRSGTTIEPFHLRTTWAPCFVTHKIDTLWTEAKWYVDYTHHEAGTRASEVGIDPPIEAVCELFSALHPEGDAFRYPSSTSGGWHAGQSTFSMEQLGRLARELEATVRAFRVADDHVG